VRTAKSLMSELEAMHERQVALAALGFGAQQFYQWLDQRADDLRGRRLGL
jgi:hypothetical protein